MQGADNFMKMRSNMRKTAIRITGKQAYVFTNILF